MTGIGDEPGEIVEADVDAEAVAGEGEERRIGRDGVGRSWRRRSSPRTGTARRKNRQIPGHQRADDDRAAVPGQEGSTRSPAGRGHRGLRPGAARLAAASQPIWTRSPRAKGTGPAGRVGLRDLHQAMPASRDLDLIDTPVAHEGELATRPSKTVLQRRRGHRPARA